MCLNLLGTIHRPARGGGLQVSRPQSFPGRGAIQFDRQSTLLWLPFLACVWLLRLCPQQQGLGNRLEERLTSHSLSRCFAEDRAFSRAVLGLLGCCPRCCRWVSVSLESLSSHPRPRLASHPDTALACRHKCAYPGPRTRTRHQLKRWGGCDEKPREEGGGGNSRLIIAWHLGRTLASQVVNTPKQEKALVQCRLPVWRDGYGFFFSLPLV